MSSDERRRAILDSARYLRGVRPLDPEEIAQYVRGGAHPAVVARVLRERAYELGIVERADGRFVPVDEEPVGPGLERVRRVPEVYVRRLDDLLVERYGPDWGRGRSGERLRERVRRLKEDYYRNRDVEYDPAVSLGYAVYHLADFYAAVQYVVDELAGAGRLGRRLRVLDVGAGVGGPALGVCDYVFGPPDPPFDPDSKPGDRTGSPATDPGADDDRPPATDLPRDPTAAVVDYHAVEPGAAADVLDTVLAETGPNFRTRIHRTTAEAFDPDDPLDGPDGAGTRGYDLLLFANVLSELDDPAGTARRYLDYLADDGALVAMAPADRATSTGLRAVERNLEAAGGTVFSPGIRLWPGHNPSDQGWSFDERPPVEVPSIQRRLDDGTGEFVKTAVRYSCSVLVTDDDRRVGTPDPDRFARMADSPDNVTDRINLAGIKLSRNLGEGDNPVFRIGDGSQTTDHYAVLARETGLNRALGTADYGDLLLFESGLLLWNDDEGGYNLVVDEETVVERVPV